MFNKFTIYDFETTGLETKFDVPLQFGAIEVDSELNTIRETEFRGRPLRHILPAPWALATTHTSIEKVFAAELGFYEFMSRVQQFVTDQSPSCLLAYNGISYDDEMMRHSLYQSLHAPYITQFFGNSRADALKLLQAAHMLMPGEIHVPINARGRLTFKLDQIAPANGLDQFDAHDALADCRATVHMLNIVRTRAPQLWNFFQTWASKAAMNKMLMNNSVVVDFYWFGKAGKALVKNVVPLVPNVSGTEWIAIDLSKDPGSYLSLTADELFEIISSGSKENPIRRIKTNAMPLVLPGEHDMARNHLCSDLVDLARLASSLRSDNSFIGRVQEAVGRYRDSFEPSELVEEQLYQPPFFPADVDKAFIERFHLVSPTERYNLVQQLSDPRARELGVRLVLSEWPEVASQSDRDTYDRFVRERLLDASPESKWTTVSSALHQITEIRKGGDVQSISIADGYAQYFHNRFPLAIAAE